MNISRTLSATALLILVAGASGAPARADTKLSGSCAIDGDVIQNVLRCNLTNTIAATPGPSDADPAQPRSLYIDYGLGEGHGTFDVFNPGGPAFRVGAKLAVTIRVGNNTPWIAEAVATDESTLTWTITIADYATFTRQLRTASGDIVLGFPNSLTPEVAFPLAGADEAMDALTACVNTISKYSIAHGSMGRAPSEVFTSPTDLRLQ